MGVKCVGLSKRMIVKYRGNVWSDFFSEFFEYCACSPAEDSCVSVHYRAAVDGSSVLQE